MTQCFSDKTTVIEVVAIKLQNSYCDTVSLSFKILHYPHGMPTLCITEVLQPVSIVQLVNHHLL